ncbi:MAG: 6-bladed beta-propeller [Tannerella sp.]|jgi:hypothetical protein|nr:6-bladed beta-propeller [Tannerella sp.]
MKYTIGLLTVFLVLSCSHSVREQTDIPLIGIDVDDVKLLKLSDKFSEVSYVPLSDSLLIGTIERVKVYEDKLFLLADRSVLVFDVNSGRALSDVSHAGGGPGEYVTLYDMLYDKNENTIELLDMNGKKVLKYGFDGLFISEFKTPFSSFAFCKITPSAYLFYNNNMESDVTNHKLVLFDTKTSGIIANYFPIDKHMATYFFVLDANNFGSVMTPSFHFSASDTVYGFTDSYIPYPKYVLNFGKHHVHPRFYRENYTDIRDFSEKAAQNSYIYAYGNFYENDIMIVFSFHYDKKTYWVLYDKNTHDVTTANRWIDDYHTNSPVDITYDNGPFALDDEYLYFFLQPVRLIELMEKEKKTDSHKSSSLDSIYRSSGFSEESNPVLVKCKVKNSFAF